MCEINEQWLAEWVDFGMIELTHYLILTDAFNRYYERRQHERQRPVESRLGA